MYDEAGHLIGEYDGKGTAIEEIVWLGDTPVASVRTGSCGISIFYIHTDHLNTPRRITRRTTSDIVWRWDGGAFGAEAPNENPSGLGMFVFNLRFAGQLYDIETGLHYNYNRDYDPGTGRYVESDPIGLRGGNYSTYGYVNDNPISYTDPLGLWVKICSRLLGTPQSRSTSRQWNPIRHDYLDVSGKTVGFYSAPGANPAWGSGVVAGQNEQDGGRCTPVCDDDRFDAYVLAAAQEIGAPTYCAVASAEFGPLGLVAEAAGARNCQSWAREVIERARHEYLSKEPCPKCWVN